MKFICLVKFFPAILNGQGQESIRVLISKIIFLILIFNMKSYSQISPGDLTKAHSNLEGMSNCTKCHVLGEQVTNAKCLDCHTEIKKLKEQGRGYHSYIGVKSKNCFECHSEHNGRSFSIINFSSEKFDHNKTGFELIGAHSNQKCDKCHQNKFIKTQLSKKKQHSYLGLGTDCYSCHEDVHQSTLGSNCETCHGNEKFQPAVNFRHDDTKFKLTGAHQKVDCNKCHQSEKRNGKKIQRFKGIVFTSCQSCHTDIHKGKFGNDCQSCHNTSSFHSIAQGSFDHSRTNFPLVGKHRGVRCNDCHKTNLSAKLKHEKCIDCHADYHKGELTSGVSIRDCSVCHNESGFVPSTFTIQQHNETKFILSGSHLALPCQNCHMKEESWHFRNIGNDCFECHKNVHGNELTQKYLPDHKCTSCHTTDNWNTISFNHSQTDFSLEGKHQNARCGKCHTVETNDGKVFKFVSSNSECITCHSDVHFGQFNVYGTSSCMKCHSYFNWKPEKFDHEQTKFSLKGAHSKLKCDQCHKATSVNGSTFIKYRLEDFKCAACHS